MKTPHSTDHDVSAPRHHASTPSPVVNSVCTVPMRAVASFTMFTPIPTETMTGDHARRQMLGQSGTWSGVAEESPTLAGGACCGGRSWSAQLVSAAEQHKLADDLARMRGAEYGTIRERAGGGGGSADDGASADGALASGGPPPGAASGLLPARGACSVITMSGGWPDQPPSRVTKVSPSARVVIVMTPPLAWSPLLIDPTDRAAAPHSMPPRATK